MAWHTVYLYNTPSNEIRPLHGQCGSHHSENSVSVAYVGNHEISVRFLCLVQLVRLDFSVNQTTI